VRHGLRGWLSLHRRRVRVSGGGDVVPGSWRRPGDVREPPDVHSRLRDLRYGMHGRADVYGWNVRLTLSSNRR